MKRNEWIGTDIVLVRHGESFNNSTYDIIREKFGENTLTAEQFEAEVLKLHDPDCGLSRRGEEQAKLLGKYLQAHQLSKIVRDSNLPVNKWRILSSPMKRCLLTAHYATEFLLPEDRNVLVHPLFYESHGCYATAEVDGKVTTSGLPGMTQADIETKFPGFHCYDDSMRDGWYNLPTKESWSHFINRMRAVTDFFWQEHDKQLSDTSNSYGNKFLCFVHGNVINQLLVNFTGNHNTLSPTNNTGLVHIKLFSRRDGEYVPRSNSFYNNYQDRRMVTVQSFNRVDHLLTDHDEHLNLLTGNEIFDDHWIQEQLDGLTEIEEEEKAQQQN